ncbi:protein kinase [Undibacterium cyanobacteriorum]|uniref:Protein kinase n=1 Tax=Undibacterium cyanobacteriorum TaxID=3073561 RepID=A0ABY9RF02_9BURK|nr:protein kinase [Undibacterium sp. 20NA77.5]WMW79803.1 protein kinase [Undibacterium sp. 20NA77.5]
MIDQKLQHETANASSIELPAELSHLEIRQSFQCQQLDSNVKLLEARDNLLQRDVLVKIVQHTQDQAEALVDEARRVAALKHFSFLKIHSLVQQEHQLCIVMESVKGQLLVDWIKERATKESTQERSEGSKERQIVRHLLDLAQAFEEARQLGLVHGNLGSDQLWVDQAGRIRILNFGLQAHRDQSDFGLAQPMQGGAQELDRRIHYLAPERFSDTRPTSAGDVFALGVIAYEMLTGGLPYAEIHGLALLAAQVQCRSEQWTWPETVSLALRNLILHMTQRELDARANYAAIVQACETIRADDSGSSSLSSSQLDALQAQFEATAKAKRRRQYAVFALLLALSGIGAWQAKPYWPQIVKALTPYSESRELELGMGFLEQYAQLPSPAYLDGASQHFTTVLARSPENAEAVAAMAYVYFQRYQSSQRDEIWMQKAKASTQQALILNPKLAMSQVANARLLQWQHELQAALTAADLSIQLAPKRILGWHTKMSILLEMGKQDDAIQFAQEGEKHFPNDRYMLDLSAGILLARGKFAEVELALKKSLARQPEGRLAYPLLAVALMRQGRDSEAMQYVQRGLEVYPSPNLYGTLGDIRLYQGNYEDAADAYEKAVSTKNGVAGSYLRWLSYAEALYWTEDRDVETREAFEKARNLLEIRLRRSPDDAFLLVNMGHILYRLGDRNAALDILGRLKKQDLMNESGLLKLAQVYELLGKRDSTIEYLMTIKKMGIPIDDRHPIFEDVRRDPKYQARAKVE